MFKLFVLGVAFAAVPAWSQVKVSGAAQQLKLVRQLKPVYPAEAKQAGITGTVRMEALIGKDGTVKEVREVSGHPLLLAPSLEAVRQWTYQPTVLNGEPIEVLTSIDVNYSLTTSVATKETPAMEVSGSRQEKKLMNRISPVYPPEAKAAGIAGLVRLEVIIGSDGRVQDIRTVSGHPLLISATVDAIREWVYEPTVVDGAPVSVLTKVDVNYTLAQ